MFSSVALERRKGWGEVRVGGRLRESTCKTAASFPPSMMMMMADGRVEGKTTLRAHSEELLGDKGTAW